MTIQKQTWLNFTNYLLVTSYGNGSVQLEIYPKKQDDMVEAYICRLWVNEKCRHSGVATMLLDTAEDMAQTLGYSEVYLHWNENEAPEWVREWYERRGYVEVGFRPRKEGAQVLMRKKL